MQTLIYPCPTSIDFVINNSSSSFIVSRFSQFQIFHTKQNIVEFKLWHIVARLLQPLLSMIFHHHLRWSQRLVLGKVSKSLKPARKWLKLPFLFLPGNRILDICCTRKCQAIFQDVTTIQHLQTIMVTPSVCSSFKFHFIHELIVKVVQVFNVV